MHMFSNSVSLEQILAEPADKEGKLLFDGFKQSLKQFPKVKTLRKSKTLSSKKKKKKKLRRAK